MTDQCKNRKIRSECYQVIRSVSKGNIDRFSPGSIVATIEPGDKSAQECQGLQYVFKILLTSELF